MRQVADRLEVVLESVVHGDERQLDQLRLSIDDLLEVADVDAEVPGLHDAQVETLLLQLEQVDERTIEMQAVGHDVAVEALDAEAVDTRFSPVLVFGT